jgi:molecular chaperone HscB
VPIAAEDNTAMPPEFLLQQMTWRERLDDANRRDGVERIATELDAERLDAYARLGAALDEIGDFRAAADQVRALMFVERLADEVTRRLESLEA